MPFYKNLVNKISISPEKKTKQKEYLKKGVLPIIDQGQDLIGGYTNQQDKMIQCELPVIIFGDHTRCVKYIDFPFGAGADGIKILQPKSDIKTKYLFYATQYLVLRMDDRGYARHYQYLEKEKLIVPPIAEQERIVARIEELFSQLDKAVETLQVVKEQLVVYRQAVLKDAFAECNAKMALEDICEHITDGDHMPPPKAEIGIPFIMISNIVDNKIVWNNVNHVKEEYYNDIGEKRTPKLGDILYTVTGSFGIPVLVDFDDKFCFQRHIALLRPNESILPEFLYYALQTSGVYSQASQKATGTAQKTVGLGVLRKITIPYIAEKVMQETIIENVKNRMLQIKMLELTVEKSLQQAENMRQSILKQAFEGKL